MLFTTITSNRYYIFSNVFRIALIAIVFFGLTSKSAAQQTYYSYQSGDWSNPVMWTTDPSGTTLVNSNIPGSNDSVIILNGRSLKTDIPVEVAALHISEGGVLDLEGSSGHDFGIFSGSGKLRLASAIFPSGIPTDFVSAEGGTVEYYNNTGFQLPETQDTYNNIIINLSNDDDIAFFMHGLTIHGNLDIVKGTLRLSDDNPAPAEDNRITLDIRKDFVVYTEGKFRVGSSPTNTVNLPGTFGGTPPYTTNQPDEGTIPGSLVPRYYDIYHKVYIGGNLLNDGSVKFISDPIALPNYASLTEHGAATVRFYGNSDAELLCNGQTDFYNLILEKGSDQTFELLIDATEHTNFRLFGRNNLEGALGSENPELRKALWIRSGTLRLTGQVVIPSLTEGSSTGTPNSDFYIPSRGALILDGTDVIVLVTADNFREVNAAYGFSETDNADYGINYDDFGNRSSLSVYGKFQIKSGYISTRRSGGFVFWPLVSGEFIINGGILDAKQFRSADTGNGIASFTQTGGVLNLRGRYDLAFGSINTVDDIRNASIDYTSLSNQMIQAARGSFNIADEANHFSMSGGTVNIYNVTGLNTENQLAIEIHSNLKNVNVTGGTFNIISANDLPHDIQSTVPLGSLTIDRLDGNAVVGLRTPLTIIDSLVIKNGVLDAGTNNMDIFINNHFIIYTEGTYVPGNNSTIFQSGGGSNFINQGTITDGLNNLILNNLSNVLISNNLEIRNNLTIENGSTLNDGGRTISLFGNMTNNGSHISSLNGNITFTGDNLQTIGGSGNGIFGNVTLTKADEKVLLLSDQTIKGDLKLNGVSSLLDIDIHELKLDGAIQVNGNGSISEFNDGKMIITSGNSFDGGLTRLVGNEGELIFPVGVRDKFTPALIDIQTAAELPFYVNIKPVDNFQPIVIDTLASLKYYWRVSSSNTAGELVSGNFTSKFYYNNADVRGDESLYVPGFYYPFEWTFFDDVFEVNVPRSEIQFSSLITADGDYTAGESLSFGNVTVYYSRGDGEWHNPDTWSTDTGLKWEGTPAGSIPSYNSPVIIGDGEAIDHNISVTQNGATAGALQISHGSTLDINATSEHFFGNVTGSGESDYGLLRISSTGATATFPGGDFRDFLDTYCNVSESCGSVEYYTSGTDFSIPTISESGLNLNSYFNLIINPEGGQSIQLAATDLQIFNDLTIGTSDLYSGNVLLSSEVNGDIEVQKNLRVYHGNLLFQNNNPRHLEIIQLIEIEEQGSLSLLNSGTAVTNTMLLHGSILNNGILQLDAGDNRVCNVTFLGVSNDSIVGSGSVNNFHSITLNKGNSQEAILNVASENFSLSGMDPALTLLNGTFRLSSDVIIELTESTPFTIPKTTCLSVNGGTITLGSGNDDNGDLLLAGKLEIISGNMIIGDSLQNVNNDIEYATAGLPEIIIHDGILDVNGQIRRGTTTHGSLNYVQHGGQLIIRGNNHNPERAKLEVTNDDSRFTMTGGNIKILRGAGGSFGDLYLRPSFTEVTGGTIELNSQTSGDQQYTIDSKLKIHNLVIKGDENNEAEVSLFVNPLRLGGNLEIFNSYSSLHTLGINVSIEGDFISNGSYIHGNNITRFTGSENQQLVANTPLSLYNVTIHKENSPIALNGTENVTIENNLRIEKGTLDDGGKTLKLLGNLHNDGLHVSQTGGQINFSGNKEQFISSEINHGVFGNLSIDNSLNVTTLANITITGNLQFEEGKLYINDHLLTMGENSFITGNLGENSMIRTNGVLSDKGVKKLFPSGNSNFTFPLGTSGKYTPAEFNIVASNTSGSVTVKPINSRLPAITDNSAEALQYYWYVESEGFDIFTVDHTYQYVQDDVVGDESGYVTGRFLNEEWMPESGIPGSVDPLENLIELSGVDYIDGEYTASAPEHLQNIEKYFSRNVTLGGDWNDPASWSNTGHDGVAATTVPDGHPVIIAEGHTILATDNNLTSYSIANEGTLNLGAFYGHSFGHVNGSGTIIMENTPYNAFVFPGGNYNNFMETTGSTIEYHGEGILPIIRQYQNITFKETGNKNIPNIQLLIMGNVWIENGVLDNSGFNKNIVIWGNWSNESGNEFIPGKGMVSFEGNSLQEISGTSPELFYNMQVNNENGLTLLSPVGINNQLNLVEGNINSSNENPLTLNSTKTNVVSGGSGNSFVNGPLRKNILTNSFFTFPIGKDSRYGEASVFHSQTGQTKLWEAEYFNTGPHPQYDTTFVEPPVDIISGDEYWNIKEPDGGQANVKLRWDSQSTVIPPLAQDRAKLRILQWDGIWKIVGNVIEDFGQDSGFVSTSSPIDASDAILTLGMEFLPMASITSGDVDICNDGTEAIVNVSLTGVPPWTLTYQINETPFTVNNIGTNQYSIITDGSVLGGPGSYEVSLTSVVDGTGSSGVKDFTSSVHINVLATPMPVITGKRFVVENEVNVVYSTPHNDDHSYNWSITGGTIENGQGTHEITVNWGVSGTGEIELTETHIATLCAAIISEEIEISSTPTPMISGNDEVCTGSLESYSTPFGEGETFFWWVSGGIITEGQETNQITVNWDTPGAGYVVVRDSVISSGNFEFDTLHVSIYLTPDANQEVIGDTICAGGTAIIEIVNAEAGVRYQVFNADSDLPETDPLTGNGNSLFFSVMPVENTGYYVVATSENFCSVVLSGAIEVIVVSQAAAIVVSDNPVCEGSEVTFTASGGDLYEFILNDVVIQNFSADNQFVSSSLQNGDNVFVVIMDNATSCVDTSDVVTMTVNPLPEATLVVSSNPACEGEELVFTASGGDEYEFIVNNSIVQAWSENNIYTVNNLENGDEVWVIVINNTTGCSDTSNVITMQIGVPPVITFNANTTEICENDEITFMASGGESYAWYVNNLLVSGPSDENEFSSTELEHGDLVYVTVTGLSGCSINSDTLEITVLENPVQPTITPAGPIALLEGQNIELTSSPATGYTWQPGGENTQSITVSEEGTYRVVVTDDNGCSSIPSNPVVVTVESILPKPVISITDPLEFCEGGSVVLTSTEGMYYEWSTGDTTRSIVVSSTSIVTVVTRDDSDNVSPTSDPVSVEVHPNPSIEVESFSDISCPSGNDGTINVSATGGTGNYTYQWSDGNTGNNNTALQAGDYFIIVTDQNGCVDSASHTLLAPGPFNVEALLEPTFCPDIANGSISLEISGGTAPYQVAWPGSQSGPNLNDVGYGNYTVTITDANSCQYSETYYLDYSNEQCLLIPTIITPNDDGHNDFWEIIGLSMFPNAVVEVYDRWGKQVFYSKGYATPWDGKLNGKDLPIDSYHYIINLNDGSKPFIGNITIIR